MVCILQSIHQTSSVLIGIVPVVSVLLFGDPTHRSEASYNYGDSSGSGVFWREDVSACDAYGDRIRSYCTAGDPFCDVGDELSGTAHVSYIAEYGEELAGYVVEQYQNGSEADAGGNATRIENENQAAVDATQESGGSRLSSVSMMAVALSLFVVAAKM